MTGALPAGFEYRPAWLEKGAASRLFQCLWDEIPWRQQPIRMFGREVLQPRLVAWCADPGVSYSYSGLRLGPEPWHAALVPVRERLCEELGTAFNSVLLNAYRDGRDSMGWHADDEPELGPRPVIASLSLGGARRLLVRPAQGGASTGLQLEHGSLLVMRGDSQAAWRHSLPKVKRPVPARINLTFRAILQA